MMHKYHNPENPGFTPKRLSSEQWENAYQDLQRNYTAIFLERDNLKKHLESKIAFLEKENETLRLERDKALASWTDHSSYHGC